MNDLKDELREALKAWKDSAMKSDYSTSDSLPWRDVAKWVIGSRCTRFKTKKIKSVGSRNLPLGSTNLVENKEKTLFNQRDKTKYG